MANSNRRLASQDHAAQQAGPDLSKSAGAVFEAHFADGTKTRMSVYTSLKRLDLARAIKLSVAAYESRTKRPAVAIVAGHFEATSGEVLREYTTTELREVQS